MELAKKDRIYLAGHSGLVGSALLKKLKQKGYTNILVKTSAELDLRNQAEVDSFFDQEKPTAVFLAAARVGGIKENEVCPADFMIDNIQIETNVIKAAFQNQAQKLIFICSSSVYPSMISNPKEDDIFCGPLQASHEGYSAAKLFGLKLCEMYHRQYGANFFSVIPCNLYGANDRFIGDGAHVVPAMLHKFHEAKIHEEPIISVWGSGRAMREFLYVEDLADACINLMELNSWVGPWINVGSGQCVTIKELSTLIKKTVGYRGEIIFDNISPEGQLLRKMDISRIESLKWKAKTPIEEGLTKTYQFYLENLNFLR